MAIFQDFITTREAAHITGYHPDYISALIRAGKVEGKKENRSWVVRKRDLEKHLMTKHYISASKVVGPMKKAMYISGAMVVIVLVVFILVAVANSLPVK